MKKYSFSINKILSNNKYAMVISIAISFVLWCVVSTYTSLSESNIDTKLLSGVAVSINLPDSSKEDALLPFYDAEAATVDVEVEANRLSLAQISKGDIYVIAKPSASTQINSAGMYTLEIIAKQNNAKNYRILSVSPRTIKVMVDQLQTETFEVESAIKFNSDPKCYAEQVSFSVPRVTVSGPRSKIKNIKKIAAVGNVPDVIAASYSLQAKLFLYGQDEETINNDFLTLSSSQVLATIPILHKKNVNLSQRFINVPEGFHFPKDRVKIEPPSIEIAGPEDIIKSLEEIFLTTIDISDVTLVNNVFSRDIDIPDNCKNLSDVKSPNLTLNLEGYERRNITIKRVEFINVPNGKHAKSNTGSIDITVVGPTKKLTALLGDEITAQIDLSDKADYSGNTEVPVQIIVPAQSGCWACGKYKANVSVS